MYSCMLCSQKIEKRDEKVKKVKLMVVLNTHHWCWYCAMCMHADAESAVGLSAVAVGALAAGAFS